MNHISVLVVDDEKDLMQLLVQRLKRKQYDAYGVESAEEAISKLENKSFDIGIFDIRMPGMDGIQLLQEAKKRYPDMEIIILTGHGTIETAIEAMKLGAYDYLTKPYNLAEMEIILEKIKEKKRLKAENKELKEILVSESAKLEIIGQSKPFQQVMQMTKKVAKSNAPVLITGESGTGKELIAKAIHYWGKRSKQPLVAINSGGLSENLLESELFGHVRGAFTGAQSDKKGLIEVADGGTIFFDEIGEMPLNLQVKLLRFFESSEFRRIGDNRLRYADVRVVAATNRNLEEEIKAGNFREDLYYRLNVITINTPSLRQRKEDIPVLIDYFLKKHAYEGQRKKLSQNALNYLHNYDFPGNVRELSHLIERGILLASGNEIEIEDMFPNMDPDVPHETEQVMTLQELEKQHIERMLKTCDGNKTKAAEALGISLRSLYRKIEEYHA